MRGGPETGDPYKLRGRDRRANNGPGLPPPELQASGHHTHRVGTIEWRNGERRAKNSAIKCKTSGESIALHISFCNIDDTLRKATLRRLAIRQAVLQRHRRAYLWARNMNLFLCSIVSPLSSEWQGEGVLT